MNAGQRPLIKSVKYTDTQMSGYWLVGTDQPAYAASLPHKKTAAPEIRTAASIETVRGGQQTATLQRVGGREKTALLIVSRHADFLRLAKPRPARPRPKMASVPGLSEVPGAVGSAQKLTTL